MNTKKAAALLVIIITICLIPITLAMNFSDIPDDFWAYTEIEELTSTGIINGYPDGTYRPHGTITKAEFLKLVLITCFPEEKSFTEKAKDNEHWVDNYYKYAQKYSLVDNTWDKENLDEAITRLEMCRLIARSDLKVMKASLDKKNKEPDFNDTKDMLQDDKNFLVYNVENKFLYGYEDGSFKPLKNMTRAEAACVIYRLRSAVESYVDYTPIKPITVYSSTKYTISYDANGGENAPASEKKVKNKPYTISSQVPTKNENEFLGWNTDPNSNDVLYVGGDTYNTNSNLKLYAVWQGKKYIVTFVDEGGTFIASGDYEYGTKSGDIVVPTDPTKSGDAEWSYAFDAWTPDIKEVTEDATYTATYTQAKNKYVVTFIDEDGTFISSGDYEYGTKSGDIVIPTEPTKSGDAEWSYEFDKWIPDIVNVIEDATYTATYAQTKNKYVVTFVDEDGAFISSGDYEYGTESGDIALPTNPTKSGDAEWKYEFEKWNPDIAAVLTNAIYTASYTKSPINAQYVSGDQFNAKIKQLATGTSSTVDTTNSNITSIKFQTSKPTDEIINRSSTINVGVESDTLLPIYAWFESGTIKLWSEAENITMSDDASYMFKDLNVLAALNPTEDLGVVSTTNVTNMSHMFEKCTNVTTLDVSGLDTSNVTNMYAMFKECQKVSSLATIATFETGNVTNMGGMFYDCRALTSLDLSTFDTSKVEEMKAMFFNCIVLSSINLTDFNTSLVTDFNGLFGNCSNLATLDISSFDTSNVTNMNLMFYNCTKLATINGIQNINTSSLQTTGSMFFNCDGLTTLNLSGWNTTALTSCNGGAQSLASGMIPQHYNGMFEECSGLTQLDLTGWNTPHLTNTSYMFAFCHNLQKIYASTTFVVTSVTSDENMFKSDTTVHPNPRLTGGNGTKYDASHIDKEYAWIDGRDANPGYFWWHSSYTIAFDGNGATSGDMENISVDYGQNKRLPTNTFTYDGKTFKEWNTEANGSGDSYADKARVKNLTLVSGDTVVLYAQWEDETYEITFIDEDGILLQSGDVKVGVMPVYSGDIPTKSSDAEWSYTFDKWIPDIVPVSGDATYRATYTQTKNRYVVTFVDDDGGFILSGDYEYGTDADDIVLPANPTKPDDAQYSYAFAGWTPEIEDVTEDATYTATYNGTEISTNKYLITFLDDDGTTLQSGMVAEGKMPKYEGGVPTKLADEYCRYVFETWYPDVCPATEDATYQANYYSVYDNDYAVIYMPNANGDYVEDMPYSDTKYEGYEYYIAYDTPKREGYRFNYWEAYSGDEITIYYPGDEYTEDADLRLYAHWTFRGFGPPIITYYDNASGDSTVANMPEPQEKPIGEEIQLSDKIPTREGYYFKGWGTRPDDYYVSWYPESYYGDDYDLDLYALWQDTTIKIGDYITYNPTPSSFTLTLENTGYDYENSDVESVINTDAPSGLYWRVWKVSGDEIQIIPSRALNEGEVWLGGITGFTVGAHETLDEICSTLYSNDDFSSSVRSQKYEDILEVAEITQNGVEHFGFAYFAPGDDTPLNSSFYQRRSAVEPLVNDFDEPRFYIWYSDEDEEIKYDLAQQLKTDENGYQYMVPIAGHPVYVKHNSTAGYPIVRWKTIAFGETNATTTSRYEQIIEGSGGRLHGDAWLATTQVFLNDAFANFEVTAFYYNTAENNKKFSGADAFYSYGFERCAGSGLGVRPIVTLRTDLKVVGGTGYDRYSAWVLESPSGD
ncbi:MAG: BspA family leucine-rich repeat surface protein [Clostridia bacterium]|nr:BspA family leucine-rich repeat surface protein [Clostridia bacterium]